ncbi:DUF3290 domain-containing protein [Salinarchaeum sp. Harcht-Bsk1]|uniref:DUF3290 domain-containing protein n=1 Tax=Salinarchaeum sp. Harcht-Bsk1 TaxID=1333523 RepID=UPI001181A068|nr:DUF3290 domain-containing protein [Salinarchaeum sp. Harcht-Bsk1]
MAAGGQLADEARKSRTSIVLLIISAASFYYSTQIQLNHSDYLWTYALAGAGIVFFIFAIILMYKDYDHDSKYRKLLRREKRAEVLSKEEEVEGLLEGEAKSKQDAESPADIADEGDPLGTTWWRG